MNIEETRAQIVAQMAQIENLKMLIEELHTELEMERKIKSGERILIGMSVALSAVIVGVLLGGSNT